MRLKNDGDGCACLSKALKRFGSCLAEGKKPSLRSEVEVARAQCPVLTSLVTSLSLFLRILAREGI